MKRLILCLLLALAAAPAWAQDWRPIPNSNSAFEASSIARLSPSVLRVWERYVLIEEALAYAREKGLSDEFRDYSYSVSLRQIDCVKKTDGFVTINNYNSRGALTAPSTNIKDGDIEMVPSAPGTSADALAKAVCNFSKPKSQNKK